MQHSCISDVDGAKMSSHVGEVRNRVVSARNSVKNVDETLREIDAKADYVNLEISRLESDKGGHNAANSF